MNENGDGLVSDVDNCSFLLESSIESFFDSFACLSLSSLLPCFPKAANKLLPAPADPNPLNPEAAPALPPKPEDELLLPPALNVKEGAVKPVVEDCDVDCAGVVETVPGLSVSQETHLTLSSLLFTIHDGHSQPAFFMENPDAPQLNAEAAVIVVVAVVEGAVEIDDGGTKPEENVDGAFSDPGLSVSHETHLMLSSLLLTIHAGHSQPAFFIENPEAPQLNVDGALDFDDGAGSVADAVGGGLKAVVDADFVEGSVAPGLSVSHEMHFTLSSLLFTMQEGHSHPAFFIEKPDAPQLNVDGVVVVVGAFTVEALFTDDGGRKSEAVDVDVAGLEPGLSVSQEIHLTLSSLLFTIHEGQSHPAFLSEKPEAPQLNVDGAAVAVNDAEVAEGTDEGGAKPDAPHLNVDGAVVGIAAGTDVNEEVATVELAAATDGTDVDSFNPFCDGSTFSSLLLSVTSSEELLLSNGLTPLFMKLATVGNL